MFKQLWCYLTHPIRVIRTVEDYKFFRCDKCNITWPVKK